VADPDEDAIDLVSLGASPTLVGTPLALQPGDEPGRMVADAAGNVHVVLRGGGGIADVTLGAQGPSLIARRAICSAPRGIDYDVTTDALYIACATGEVATLPASGGAITAMVDLDQTAMPGQGRDLRDVVVNASNVYVSQMRSASIVTLDKALNFVGSAVLLMPNGESTQDAVPDVAWRMVRRVDGGLQVVYQTASTDPINVATPPGVSSYGGNNNEDNTGPSNGLEPQPPENSSAGGVVTAAVASFTQNAWTSVQLMSNPVVDVAVASDGSFETIAVDGHIETTASVNNGSPLSLELGGNATANSPNMYVAIADAQGAAQPVIVVQRRGPSPALLVLPAGFNNGPDLTGVHVVTLPQKALHVDTGFDAFHMPTAAGIACMSCHPEGGDDGHVWQFSLINNELRQRRTQNLRGGVVLASAPYHWDGDMTDIQALCDEVFTHRMGGGAMTSAQTPILSHFLNSIPRVPVKATLDQNAVAQGLAIFQGAGGCTACHVGGTGTLVSNQDIGKVDTISTVTEKALQVPMLLGVADRAPYMHDGCAGTLMDRLQVNACAGTHHGNVAALTEADKQNLATFLQTL
jgi:hypothetical protein